MAPRHAAERRQRTGHLHGSLRFSGIPWKHSRLDVPSSPAMVEPVCATNLDLSRNAVWNRMGGSTPFSIGIRVV